MEFLNLLWFWYKHFFIVIPIECNLLYNCINVQMWRKLKGQAANLCNNNNKFVGMDKQQKCDQLLKTKKTNISFLKIWKKNCSSVATFCAPHPLSRFSEITVLPAEFSPFSKFQRVKVNGHPVFVSTHNTSREVNFFSVPSENSRSKTNENQVLNLKQILRSTNELVNF